MKARKLITGLAMLLIVGMTTSVAQIQVGIKAGATINNSNISGVIGDVLPSTSTDLGYNIGFYGDIPMNSHFSFHPELGFTTRGFRMDQGTSFNVVGIDIPVGASAVTNMKYVENLALIRYKIGNDKIKGFVEAGLGVAIATSAYIQPKATLLLEFNLPRIDIDLSDDLYSRTDYSANIGTGVEYNSGQGVLSANVRYTHGLSNVLNDPIINTQINHRSFTLGVAYGYIF